MTPAAAPSVRRIAAGSPPWGVVVFALLLLPAIPAVGELLRARTSINWVSELTQLAIYALLALGLNVVVGFSGQLHLGIAAFFALGAYSYGVLTVGELPFQWSFWPAAAAAVAISAAGAAVLSAPALRLRGDYLAIVTLGFGEVVRITLKKWDQITGGARTLNPLPKPRFPAWLTDPLGGDDAGAARVFYVMVLLLTGGALWALHNLNRSKLGRAWAAVREDELAAAAMGVDKAWTKTLAQILGGALAGAAGALYATHLTTTGNPDNFGFNLSISMLCCLILGGLGSLRGTVVGVVLLMGYNNILAPALDGWLQRTVSTGEGPPPAWLQFSNWNLMIFGLALVLMMRFRPEGLLPSRRMQLEMHSKESSSEAAA